MTLQEATQLLFDAARSGNLEQAKAALDAGADPDAKNDDKWTPLHWAVGNGHTTIARLLIEKAANVNAKDNQQRTPLHWAAAMGHTDLGRLLIENGANVNARNYEQWTPLHWAAATGHTAIAWLLIENGADPAARDAVHYATPLNWAVHNERDATVKLLEKAARNKHGHVTRVVTRRGSDEPQRGR